MESTATDLPELQEETRFNINHKVKVILTPRGHDVLLEKVLELHSSYSDNTVEKAKAAIHVLYERDDAYIFQMYEFMAIFGSKLPTVATMDRQYYLFEGNNLILLPD